MNFKILKSRLKCSAKFSIYFKKRKIDKNYVRIVMNLNELKEMMMSKNKLKKNNSQCMISVQNFLFVTYIPTILSAFQFSLNNCEFFASYPLRISLNFHTSLKHSLNFSFNPFLSSLMEIFMSFPYIYIEVELCV